MSNFPSDSRPSVDLTQAIPTKRHISLHFSCRTEHNQRIYLAHSVKYGCVRATLPDSPFSGVKFLARLRQVWPNASIQSH